MIFVATSIPGVFEVQPERIPDERGFFARTWCAREFAERGLNPRVLQCSVSYNRSRGTLRGLHRQVAPHEEAKLVTCIRGAAFDVVVDLRPDSPTHSRWTSVELTATAGNAVYVPEGVAHGFLTLQDDTVLHYSISELYYPDSFRGVRWNDPTLAIAWPLPPMMISLRDRELPTLSDWSRAECRGSSSSSHE